MVLAYALLAGLWVFLSDLFLERLATSQHALSVLQTYKGLFFVAVTVVLLYLGILGLLKRQERIQAELRASQADLQARQEEISRLISNIPGMVYRCKNDRNWTMEFVSEGSLDLTGYSPSDLVANRTVAFADLIHPEDRERVREEVQEAIAEGRPFELTYRLQLQKQERWVRERGRGVFDAAGHLLALEGIVSDITEVKKFERYLAQSQKLEALGALSAEVAHEFRNVLTGISGYAQLVSEQVGYDPVLRQDLDRIQALVEYSAGLVNKLLVFGQREASHPAEVYLNSLIEDLCKVFKRLLGKDIELSFLPDLRLPTIRADRGQIEQVLMNLVLNARDAMPEGGKLTIQTERVEVDRKYARAQMGAQPGPYVRISVSDSGCGMDEATRERIFEPFFYHQRGSRIGSGLVGGLRDRGMAPGLDRGFEPGGGRDHLSDLSSGGEGGGRAPAPGGGSGPAAGGAGDDPGGGRRGERSGADPAHAGGARVYGLLGHFQRRGPEPVFEIGKSDRSADRGREDAQAAGPGTVPAPV